MSLLLVLVLIEWALQMLLRKQNIDQLKNELFDVVVLGDGINGAVAAAALSTKGAKVALINKDDFTSFTSMFMGLELKKSSSYVSW